MLSVAIYIIVSFPYAFIRVLEVYINALKILGSVNLLAHDLGV